MPPRWITLGIVLFWAATAAWFVYRETVEKPSQPPPFTIDRTDEIGTQIATWTVSQGGKFVGQARTRLGRNPKDFLYDSTCDYSTLDGLTYRGLIVRQLSSQYRVTLRGELKALSCSLTLAPPFGPTLRADINCGFWESFSGRVESSLSGECQGCGSWERHQVVFNLLHPLHKVAGLSEGRRWQVQMLDPLMASLGPEAGGGKVPNGTLQAVTTADTLDWHRTPVPCWRVDFRDDGGAVRASVWVRQRDHLVLRQDAYYGGTPVVLERKLLG